MMMMMFITVFMAGSAAHVLYNNDITMMLVKNSDNDAEDSGGPCSKQKHDLQAVEKGFGVGRTERLRGQVPSTVDLLLILLKNMSF